MSLIGKIREKTGLIVGAVAIGLILFLVGGDLLGPSSQILGGPDKDVGEIAGETVSIEEYQQAINEMKLNYSLNTGRNPSEEEMNSIRQQAWSMLVAQKAFEEEYEELGIEVPRREMVDMVQGNNINPSVRQSFTNPQTGEFDRNQVVAFLQQFDQLPQQQQVSWQLFEKGLGDARERLKFENLLIDGNFVTTQEAKQRYQEENTVAEVQYLYVPSVSVSDSAVQVTDQQLETYLQDHADEYQVEAGRTIEYVKFPIIPSEQDRVEFREELGELREAFVETTNDSTYATNNTDAVSEPAYRTYYADELPEALAGNPDNLAEGSVIGPIQTDNEDVYRLYKISEIAEDTVSRAEARHILFKTEDKDKAEVRKQARDVLQQLKEGADFATLAQQYSEDPGSGQQGGNLGWFSENQMVGPFDEAVFSAQETGLVNKLVETDFGYHIIDVQSLPSNRQYTIATIERELYPSDVTRDEAFRQADLFDSEISNLDEFRQRAQQDSLAIETEERINANAQSIQGLEGTARPIVRWAFTDADVGNVSEVYELENAYVVAALTGKTEKGTAALDQVRDEVTAKVKSKLKSEQIAQKLQGMSGNLDEIAQAYGQDANVYSTSDLKLSANNLPNVGTAPQAIGVAFGLKEGERSKPVIIDNGVVMIELQALTAAPEIADYATYKDQIKQQNNERVVSQSIAEAIEENANIEDERYKFY